MGYATVKEVEEQALEDGVLDFLDCDALGESLKLTAGLTDSSLSLTFQELTSPLLKRGLLIKIDDEVVRVDSSPVYLDAPTNSIGSFDIKRAQQGTTAAVHSINTVATIHDPLKTQLNNKALDNVLAALGIGTRNDLYLEGDEDLRAAQVAQCLWLFENADYLAIAERIAAISAGEYEDKTLRVEYPATGKLSPIAQRFIDTALELNGEGAQNAFDRG